MTYNPFLYALHTYIERPKYRNKISGYFILVSRAQSADENVVI